MSLPEATLEILDPGLGQVPASFANAEAAIGVCSKGLPNTFYSIGSPNSAKSQLGSGPLVEAILQRLSVAGAPVYAVPASPVSAGAVGATAHTGPGAGAVVGSAGPAEVIVVKIILGGAVGTATFQVKVGTGGYGSTITTAATYVLPGTLTTLAFAAGTYVANDTYTHQLIGTVTLTGTGPATGMDTTTHNAVDNFAVSVKIGTAGALGTATFQYALDSLAEADHAYGAQILVPSGAGKYAIPGTGIVLTFASTFVSADLYTFAATTAGYTTTAATDALTALGTDPRKWALLHVVGTAATETAAATLAAVVATAMNTFETNYRYARAIIECPSTGITDANILAAFDTEVVNSRVGVCVGEVDTISPTTGRTQKRNLAWAYMARLGAIPFSEHPGRVRRGPIKNVTRIYRDEAATPVLNDQRFVTSRTFVGLPGYFITAGKMMASAGSDFDEIQRCRVMDQASDITRQALVLFVNESVRVDPKTGFIDERDAQKIEAEVRSKLKAALVSPGHASAVNVVVDRAANILSTGVEPVTISVTPLAYMSTIQGKIGFANPALSA